LTPLAPHPPLRDFYGDAARVRLVDAPRVLLGAAIEDARVAALRVLHFLVAEERADVERLLVA